MSGSIVARRAIVPAAITASSTMSGSVSRLRSVLPAAITATSSMSGSINRRRPVAPAGITATSSMSGSVSRLRPILPAAITATSSMSGAGALSVTHIAYVRNFAAAPPRVFVEINFPKHPARFSTREAILADQPDVFHELNETSGTTALDSSGNGNNGTFVASPTLAQASIRRGQRGLDPAIPPAFAALFGSTSQYVQNTLGPAAPSEITLSATINPTAYPTAGNKYDFVTNTGTGRISILSSGLVEASFGTTLQSSVAVPLNDSTHVAVTVSGTGSLERHRIYFDGDLVAEAVGPSSLSSLSATYRAGAIGGTSATAFKGTLELFAIFLEALRVARLKQHAVGHTVEVAPPDLWSDVSLDVRSWRRARGRAQRLDRFEAATMPLELDNSRRQYEPGFQGTISVLNFLENPSFETGIQGWSATNGTISRWTTGAANGSWSGKFTAVGSGDMTIFGMRAVGSSVTGIVPGTVYRANSGLLSLTSAAGSRTVDAYIEWRDAVDAVLSSTLIGSRTLTNGGGGSGVGGSVTAPANAVKARLKLIARSMLANEVVSVDSVMLGADVGSALITYRDGDTQGYYWEGTPHASRTIQSSVYYPFLLPMRRVRVRTVYPGNNLLQESSFETLTLPAYNAYDNGELTWIDQNSSGVADASIVSSGAFHGSKAIKFVPNFPGSEQAKLTAGRKNWISVAGTPSLAISAYFKRDVGAATNAKLQVACYDHAGAFIDELGGTAGATTTAGSIAALSGATYADPAGVDPGTSWTRYGAVFTFAPEVAYVAVRLVPFDLGASPAAVYADAVQVEPGTAATPYVLPVHKERFNGYITSWPQSYEEHVRSRITVNCVDAFAGAAIAEVSGTLPQQLSGGRLNRLLDLIGVPTAERAIDTGVQQIVARTLDHQGGLSEMQDTADSELGALFLDGRGWWTFHDANHRTTSSRSTSVQATFGDGGPGSGELPMILPVQADFDVTRVLNEAKISREPATDADKPVEQVAADGPSQGDSWKRTVSRTTLLATDAACLAQAQALVAAYKDPKKEVRSFSIDPLRDASLWPIVLGMEISDRVRLVLRPQGITPADTQDYFIESEADDVSLAAGKLTWRTTYATSLAG